MMKAHSVDDEHFHPGFMGAWQSNITLARVLLKEKAQTMCEKMQSRTIFVN